MSVRIGVLLFPGLTQLDLAGPYEFFHRIPEARVHLVWKTRQVVSTEEGYGIVADTSFADCPPVDVLFVPGGFGQVALARDVEVLDFLRRQAAGARYVTSVCTGSLLLGAAGLLEGYRATTHWAYTELLSSFGATYEPGRVVRDRNRITAGGVTAGIDFGLTIVAELAGESTARAIQLGLEYDPSPPFACGNPEADPALAAILKERLHERARVNPTSAA